MSGMEMDPQNTNEQAQAAEPATEEMRPPLFRMALSKPVEVINYVLGHQPEEFIHRHFIFVGIAFVLLTRIPDWLATTAHPIGVMIQVLLVGPVMGIMLGYIYAAATRNLAKLFDVLVDKQAMRAIVAWTNFPFGVAYLLSLAAYLGAYFARPATAKQFILADGITGWIPIVVFGIAFSYALFLRWHTIKTLFRISYFQAVLIWVAAFVITYGLAILIGITYFSLYTGSLEWIGRQ